MTPSAYRDALSHIQGPRAYIAAREESLRRFLQAGLPDSHEEDWHYTSLAHLERMLLHAPERQPELLPLVENYPGAQFAYLDDGLVWQDSPLPAAVLCTLAEAVAAEGVPENLGRLAGTTSLTQLNSALWREGVCLRVGEGQRLRQPIFLRFAAAAAGVMLYPRVFVDMARGSDAILVEHFHGEPGLAYWQNPVSEIVLAPGARLTHLRLIEDSGDATHTGLTAIRLDQSSQYRALNLTLGGQVARHEVHATLVGRDAEVRLDGIFIAQARRAAEQHLRILHQGRQGRSRTLYRGLADGRGRGVFDARVEVHPHADGCDARQSSRNLLLSPHAEIDVRPQLEIYADDVKCSHAATVGSLDEAALFYLRSRGIDGNSARRLLLEAFIGEAIGLLDDTGLRDWCLPRLLARMPGTWELSG